MTVTFNFWYKKDKLVPWKWQQGCLMMLRMQAYYCRLDKNFWFEAIGLCILNETCDNSSLNRWWYLLLRLFRGKLYTYHLLSQLFVRSVLQPKEMSLTHDLDFVWNRVNSHKVEAPSQLQDGKLNYRLEQTSVFLHRVFFSLEYSREIAMYICYTLTGFPSRYIQIDIESI